MSISKLRNSTAIDAILTNEAVTRVLTLNSKSDLDQSNKAPQDTAPHTTVERVNGFLRGISENSTGEIDALISDLSVLRQKLVTDGSKIEQHVTDFAALNQSVLSLTKIVSEGVAQVKEPPTH